MSYIGRRGQKDSKSVVAWVIGLAGLLFLGVIIWSATGGRMSMAFTNLSMISQAPTTTGYGVDEAR